ncbi:MAG: hypothetical protein K9M99_08695 [Candidatus Cloacimonetes bacterium]|nr:hypothetical protein [Candidatus Cloacimonadota bacterium]
MKKTVLIIAIMLLGFSLWGGVCDGYYNDPDFRLPSLFNENNFKMSHSLTFSSGVSSTGDGYYSNTYTNHLNFKLHKNLDFKLNLNFVNDGTMNFNQDYDVNWNSDNASHIIPEFQLEWRPSENTTLRIQFEQHNYMNRWHNSFFEDDDPFISDK